MKIVDIYGTTFPKAGFMGALAISLRHYSLQTRLRKSNGKVNIYLLAKTAGTSVDQLERFCIKKFRIHRCDGWKFAIVWEVSYVDLVSEQKRVWRRMEILLVFNAQKRFEFQEYFYAWGLKSFSELSFYFMKWNTDMLRS